MSAREEILARIVAATGRGGRAVEVPRAYRVVGEHPSGGRELLDLFIDRLEDYHATVHRCVPEAAADMVGAALAGRGVRRLVVPPQPPVTWSGGEVLTDDPPQSVEDIDAADGVLTACAVAVAETGTIVLDGSPDQGRRVITLVPDYHLVVVRADQVVQTVPEALRRLDPRRPLTWISGPSATSDIELNRVEGVHGPRTLDVILTAID